MRKNTLLIATAVAALTAGSSLAFAQGGPDTKSNPAAKSAPAEKIAPSPSAKPAEQHAPAPSAQRSEEKAAPANRMGQTSEPNKAKSETTGQAPNQPAQATPKQDKLDTKSEKSEKSQKSEHNGAAEKSEQRNRATTGQAPENRNNMENRPGQSTQQNRAGQGGMNQQGAAPSNQEGTTQNRAGTSSSTSANLTTEQRTKIHSVIIAERSAPRVARVDFDVHVGTVVPRGKVKYVPLPQSIVEIEPAWRGYEYFLVGEEIVVVNPATLEIVAVIPA
jgi:hypothetical protein